MGLFISDIKVEIREIILRNKPEEMLQSSPKGTVPVLVLNDGTVIDESLDIMHWALAQNDPDSWLGSDKDKAANIIAHNDGEFKKALDRYKYPNRYPDEDCSGARNICERTFYQLDKMLQTNKFLLAGQITLADIATFPFIRQCANVDRVWFDSLALPNLQKWLQYNLDSDLFSAIMIKLAPWSNGDEPIYFCKS